jgi:hypothetical protein
VDDVFELDLEVVEEVPDGLARPSYAEIMKLEHIFGRLFDYHLTEY